MNKLILLSIFLLPFSILAQESTESTPSRAFGNITLGMNYDAVLDALASNGNFVFHGRPDVSFRDPLDRTIIEVQGAGFVHYGFFAFYDDALFTITIVLNSQRLDYFTLWSHLVERYGDPSLLDPFQSLWENENTRLSLEQPGILKYIDMQIFNTILNRNLIENSTIERSRERFLEDL